MLRLAATRDPSLTVTLAADLARGAFPAIVLFRDLDAPGADEWYAGRNLGLPLVALVRRGYRRAAEVGPYHLYVPRGAPAGDSDVPRAAAVVRGTPPR
jgi:hypothetical protein